MKDLSCKEVDAFNEVRIEQVCKIQNSEVVHAEYVAQMFFAIDDVWDPKNLQNEVFEDAPLGSLSNYRRKCLVS